MKPIHAWSCVSENGRKKAGSAVCFVLNGAHANHTIRVFLRDQGPGAIAKPIAVDEAWRLIEEAPTGTNGRAATDAAADGTREDQSVPAKRFARADR